VPSESLPDTMTGNDLVVQEQHESNVEKLLYDDMDRVDRSHKRGEVKSFVANRKYRDGFDRIWGKNES